MPWVASLRTEVGVVAIELQWTMTKPRAMDKDRDRYVIVGVVAIISEPEGMGDEHWGWGQRRQQHCEWA